MNRTLSGIGIARLLVVLVLVLCWLVPAAGVLADEPQLEEAPKLPEPVEPPPVIDGHGTGYRPPRMDLSHLTGKIPSAGLKLQQSPPTSWDWRDEGMVTSVKNQGGCGSCYAFAALANIESKLLIDSAGSYDLSENNAKECNWHETDGSGTSCDGGFYNTVVNFFSQKGSVLESDDPYIDSDVACSTYPYQQTLLDWRIINGSSVPATGDLKTYIYNYGPVFTSIYAGDGDAWDTEFGSYDGSYTLYHAGTETPNHAVVIVGWDDSLTHSGGTGGWIVKNSWGTGWGGTCGYGTEGGYFTIAYGSASIGRDSSFMYGWQDYDENGAILYYDEAGWGTSFGQQGGANTTAWGLCKFTASSSTYVTSVEFWTTDITTDVDVYIYDSFDGTNLGTLQRSSLNHSFDEAGYHSVKLTSPLSVSTDDDIVAVVKFTNSSDGYPVAADNIGPNETTKTYISLTGADGSWTDMGTLNPYYDDVAIRVRTSDYPTALFTLESYNELGQCDTFTTYATDHTVFMQATDLVPNHNYRVAYYDGSGSRVEVDDNVPSDGSGNLSSEHILDPGSDTEGDWYAIIYETKYTAPPNYDAAWACTLVEDTFHVDASAIPEFPTALAALAAMALSAGIYLWMRRRVTSIPATE